MKQLTEEQQEELDRVVEDRRRAMEAQLNDDPKYWAWLKKMSKKRKAKTIRFTNGAG